MSKLIPILIIFSIQAAFGQANDSLILTAEQNEIWISKVQNAPLEKQLELIRNRILSDTNVYVRTYASDRILVRDESQNSKKKQSFGRPLIILGGQCEHFSPNINNKTDNSSIELLASFLTPDNIEEITILTDYKATALYGSRAVGGVFILAVKKRLICKSIKKLDFGKQ